LKNIKQYDFKNIKKYKYTILEKSNLYSLGVGCTKDEFNRNLVQAFFDGLGKRTREDFIECNLMYDLEGTEKHLRKLEKNTL